MEADYIQLPPMPSDTPTELIGIVWTYARMEKSEKEKRMKLMEESKLKPTPYVEEFNSLMQELIGTIIAQSCEMSALVYQKYCIEGNSIKEISETIHVPENSIEY